jgi:hypothetical protein
MISERKKLQAEGNVAIAAGSGIGAFGLSTYALAGTVCPLCYVAVPGFLAWGAYKHIKAKKDINNVRDQSTKNQ